MTAAAGDRELLDRARATGGVHAIAYCLATLAGDAARLAALRRDARLAAEGTRAHDALQAAADDLAKLVAPDRAVQLRSACGQARLRIPGATCNAERAAVLAFHGHAAAIRAQHASATASRYGQHAEQHLNRALEHLRALGGPRAQQLLAAQPPATVSTHIALLDEVVARVPGYAFG